MKIEKVTKQSWQNCNCKKKKKVSAEVQLHLHSESSVLIRVQSYSILNAIKFLFSTSSCSFNYCINNPSAICTKR